jgi:hypothetical protein
LVELAVKQDSSDNISVIVVFLKEPHLITKDWTSAIYKTSMDTMDTMESAFEENSATLKNNSDNQVRLIVLFLSINGNPNLCQNKIFINTRAQTMCRHTFKLI